MASVAWLARGLRSVLTLNLHLLDNNASGCGCEPDRLCVFGRCAYMVTCQPRRDPPATRATHRYLTVGVAQRSSIDNRRSTAHMGGWPVTRDRRDATCCTHKYMYAQQTCTKRPTQPGTMETGSVTSVRSRFKLLRGCVPDAGTHRYLRP